MPDDDLVSMTFTAQFASYFPGEVAAFRPDQAQELLRREVAEETPPPTPPENIDVPYVSQQLELLNCTMGNWSGTPTDYAYQWMRDGTTAIGVGGSTYIIDPADIGRTLSCIVTASNAAGATESPPSNGIVIPIPATATSAVLGSETFSDDELSGLIGDLAGNGGAWLGFDIIVDGTQRQVRQQFGSVTTGQDICARIDAVLGQYATTTIPGTAAPWRFFITSNTAGAASTIGYALPPTSLAEDDEADPMKATTDISLVLRLTQATGATLAQGTDAT